MLNLLGRIKSHNGRFSLIRSFTFTISRFSSSPANYPEPKSENSDQGSFSATYLKNKCEFSPEKAVLYSKYLKFDSAEKPESVIAFFKAYGFSDAQILCIVRKWPLVFQFVPESGFLPKIEFLRSLGFSTPDIIEIVTGDPFLLARSLEGQLIPCVDLLRRFLSSDKDVMFSIMRFPGLMRQSLGDVLLPNIETLKGAGVPESYIAAFLRINSRVLVTDPVKFRVIVEEVKKLGLNPQAKIFVSGIMVKGQLSSSTWKEKISFYEGWGLSEHQVLVAFRMFPHFMAASKDKATRVFNLLVNEMGLDASFLMKQPKIVSLSFEKTIAPRCAFYQVLLSKALIKPSCSLRAMLVYPQRLFIERYVRRFEGKDPEILKQYQEIFRVSNQ